MLIWTELFVYIGVCNSLYFCHVSFSTCSKYYDALQKDNTSVAVLLHVFLICFSLGGLGAYPVECISSASHHQPGAECHDPSHSWQPSS